MGFGDVLTISTDIPGDSPHPVTLTQTARGAILQFDPLTIATHDSMANHFSFVNFSVLNAGNGEGTFQLGDGVAAGTGVVTNIAAPAGTWTSNLAGGNLIGGASSQGSLTVKGPLPTTCGGGGAYTCGTAKCTTAVSCSTVGGNCGTMDDGCGEHLALRSDVRLVDGYDVAVVAPTNVVLPYARPRAPAMGSAAR